LPWPLGTQRHLALAALVVKGVDAKVKEVNLPSNFLLSVKAAEAVEPIVYDGQAGASARGSGAEGKGDQEREEMSKTQTSEVRPPSEVQPAWMKIVP